MRRALLAIALLVSLTAEADWVGVASIPTFDFVGDYRTDCGSACTVAEDVWTKTELATAFAANPTARAYWMGTYGTDGGLTGAGVSQLVYQPVIDYYQEPGVTEDFCPMIDVRADVTSKKAASDTTLSGLNTAVCVGAPVNVCADWDGSQDGVGTDGFDTSWVLIADWAYLIANVWNGDDPCDGGTSHDWGNYDKASACALRSGDDGPVLYGTIDASTNLLTSVSGLATDLRIPAFRAWKIANLEEALDQDGITGSECGYLRISFKAGWWGHYGPGGDGNCSGLDPDSNAREGYQHPDCTAITGAAPLHPTPYGPGELQAAVSALIVELRTALDISHPSVGIVLVDRPGFLAEKGRGYTEAARRAVVGLHGTMYEVLE